MDILDLIERIDTLITKGAGLSNTKAQLATLHERVSALLAEHENLAAAHSTLQKEHTELAAKHQRLMNPQPKQGLQVDWPPPADNIDPTKD